MSSQLQLRYLKKKNLNHYKLNIHQKQTHSLHKKKKKKSHTKIYMIKLI